MLRCVIRIFDVVANKIYKEINVNRMQLHVILLVSVIGLSLGDVLKVKCGDETCESE